MTAFIITSNEGKSTDVEAPNWMLAMGQAIAWFQQEDGIDAGVMGRWVCTPGADDSVFVDDPVTRRSWIVRKRREAPPPRVQASPRTQAMSRRYEASERAREARERVDEQVGHSEVAPPPLEMPRSTLALETQPSNLAERLFDLSFDIAGETATRAANLALSLLKDFIPCEAGSIVRGTLNDPQLTFLAATGPVGRRLVGRTMQYGTGLIGIAYDRCVTIVVNDVQNDDRHFSAFDEATGFDTRSVLCVPVVDAHGESYGVIQLINPPERFKQWHVECAEMVAKTLVGPLSAGT